MNKLNDYYGRFETACSELEKLSNNLSRERSSSEPTQRSLSTLLEHDNERFNGWEKRLGRLEGIICDLPTRTELSAFMLEVRRKADWERAMLEHLRKLCAISVPPSTPQLGPPPFPRPSPATVPPPRTTTLRSTGPAAGQAQRRLP